VKKRLFILLYFSIYTTLSGVTYHISTEGNDFNPGNIKKPFYTLNKAWTVVSAGDTVYLHGGTYHYTEKQYLAKKAGRPGNFIEILAFPGEYPVIDYGRSSGVYIGICLEKCDYIHIKGLRITNLSQPKKTVSGLYGLILTDSVHNCTIESLETDHIGGWGVVIGDHSSNILFLNCDSHHNADPFSESPYGGSDGFETGSKTSTNIKFKGCRAWSNSDDGWDLRQANGVYEIDNCWSFWNGYIPDTFTDGGDGDGYKLGGKTPPPTNEIVRIISRSIAFRNRGTGITPEPDGLDQTLGVRIYNCTAYDNASGWGNGINTGGYNNYTVVRNCIDFSNNGKGSWMQSTAPHDHNTFDTPVTVSAADFINLDSKEVDGPRQKDGSLPEIDFLHLSKNSHLIDAGTKVGLPYSGKSPDIGAFEMKQEIKTDKKPGNH
jgi:hypothetical protein